MRMLPLMEKVGVAVAVGSVRLNDVAVGVDVRRCCWVVADGGWRVVDVAVLDGLDEG